MSRTARIAAAIAMMILMGLMLGCGSHSDAVARARDAKTITREQVEQLAQLSDNATKEDVVAILGQPNQDSSGAGDQRGAMIQAFGADYVYQYMDTMPPEHSWWLSEGAALQYNTGQMIPGKPLSSLTVNLRNNRINSYHWLDFSQLLPEAMLAKVKPLMKVVSRLQLQESLGPPNRIGGFNHCSYAFQAPPSIAALGLDALEARWEGGSQNELKFVSIQPVSGKQSEPAFIKMSAADHKTMAKAGRQTLERMQKKQNIAGGSPQASRASMVTEYHALLERELMSHGHVESGQWVERSQGVLKKLQPLLPNNFGPIRLVVLQSNAFNACAMRRGRDITLVLYTGLLEHLADDHELAFVVAHELSHISLWHLYVPVNYMIQRWGGFFDAIASYWYRMSQVDEHGADLMAAQLVARAGFNPAAGLSFLAKAQERNPPPAELRFSTHPEHEARRIMLNWYLDFLGLKRPGASS